MKSFHKMVTACSSNPSLSHQQYAILKLGQKILLSQLSNGSLVQDQVVITQSTLRVARGKVVIRRQKQEPTVLTFQLNLLPDKIRTPKCGLPPPPPTMQSHAIPHKTMQY